ncbi:hypothetical protein BJ138DRAFT_1135213 [Hygrophoropsis aurantiaca]|uniref:Uncharacterized protein n=1 Tax=Hygrophoropsis aurantiaca TaxID=72124 RepID=A0ACB8AFQ4_9AGAM|nr:hypothetical protein BJ138DRAFT_1135213 [Hygrophoropsis aurantiaca]
MASILFQWASDACRTIIPPLHERIPVSKGHWPYALLPLPPFILMAYLARRPDTYTLRILLLPIVLTLAVGTAFRFTWIRPEFNVYNWGQALVAEVISTKAIDYAWRREGMLKNEELTPGKLEHSSEQCNGAAAWSQDKTPRSCLRLLPSCLYDAFELIFSMRGLGWKYGIGIHVPREYRPSERTAFLWSTSITFFKSMLVFDFLESLIKLVPGVGSPQGGTIFLTNLLWPQRLVLSILIHLSTSCCILAGFEMVYSLVTLFSVIIVGSPSTAWPPILDNPWQSDSLHTFWAKRWHQVLRQTFFVLGGYPGRALAGNYGMILGTFIGSGLYHECAAYAMGLGFDFRVFAFFAGQAPLLCIEKTWAKVTGHRVGGIYGRLWVYFCVLIMGLPLADSWHTRGLGGALIVPPSISLVRRIAFPLFKRMAVGTGIDLFVSS